MRLTVSGVGGGDAGTSPPPIEIEKIVIEIWSYLPEVYTFRKEAELQKYLVANCEKSPFSIEILIKKSQFS